MNSSETSSLNRFTEAQENTYKTALAEIKNGRKRSHWMWFIFPQVQGLGQSETSRFYAIKNLQEAEAYLSHPVLGKRLVDISRALMEQEVRDAGQVFGSPDDMKLCSSMTLFSEASNADPVFDEVLDSFFGGKKDGQTLRKLGLK